MTEQELRDNAKSEVGLIVDSKLFLELMDLVYYGWSNPTTIENKCKELIASAIMPIILEGK